MRNGEDSKLESVTVPIDPSCTEADGAAAVIFAQVMAVPPWLCALIRKPCMAYWQRGEQYLEHTASFALPSFHVLVITHCEGEMDRAGIVPLGMSPSLNPDQP